MKFWPKRDRYVQGGTNQMKYFYLLLLSILMPLITTHTAAKRHLHLAQADHRASAALSASNIVKGVRTRLDCFLLSLQERIFAGEALRVLELVISDSIAFAGGICDQFRLCGFVECEQSLLTIGCAVVHGKNFPLR